MKPLIITAITVIGLFTDLRGQSYSLQVLGQSYMSLTNPDYHIPDTSPYFGNVQTSPSFQFEAFEQNYNLGDGVFVPLKQGYAYFINSTHSTTLYAAKGLYAARQGANQTSSFSFKETGATGNKVYVMQWENMGFANGDSADFNNFQMHLYQATGIVEYHFGSSSVSSGLYENGANGPTIGLLNMNASFSAILEQLWLQGTPSSPVVVTTNGVFTLSGTPANGTVYQFTPIGNVHLPETFEPHEFEVYPTIVDNGYVYINSETGNFNVKVINSVGQEVLSQQHLLSNSPLDVSSLTSGIGLAPYKSDRLLC